MIVASPHTTYISVRRFYMFPCTDEQVMRQSIFGTQLFLLALLCFLAPLAAEPKSETPKPDSTKPEAAAESDTKFIRVKHSDDQQPLAMETAIVSYAAEGGQRKGVIVDLVAAVHVGDKTYYDQLNKQFESYDVLLYELVAPEGTRVPKGGRKDGGNAISSLQGGLKSLLALEYQLEKIDYTKDNFVHADMSPKEFAKSMKDRGESFWQILFRAMGQSAALQASGKQPISDADLLFALLSKDRSLRMKKLLARQFEDMESSLAILNGPDGSTLITERNKKCLEVLNREIKKGHKRIGIFYGAGHLPDMEERLAKDFHLKPGEQKWLVAWDLSGKKAASDEKPKTPQQE